MSAQPSDSAGAIQRDIVIVGGGLAGAATAAVLARRGLSVTVIDRFAEFPPMFRAEKIEPDQANLLRKLGLFEGVQPRTRVIHEIIHGQRGRIVHRRPIEQFGISYQNIVIGVREQLPAEVELRIGSVVAIEPHARQPSVSLSDGSRYQGRLVVLAAGMNGPFPEQLGARKQMVKDELSTTFGFMLERTDGKPFDFDAVTYRPRSTADRVGYLTLFRMGEFMRGNLFAYWSIRDPSTRELVSDSKTFLGRVLAGLDAVIGPYAVSGRVEPFRIDLYRMQDCGLPGLVMLGDAYQSVCPSTGTGLSKVLNDVDVLCNTCLPGWLQAPAIDAPMTAAFYTQAQKQAVDDLALRLALAGRESVISTSLAWRIRRQIRAWRFAGGW
jgi:2-polyprenyl-6-methoxyphenol hydroxylase-like FAD-dependent oxidoreductase